MYFGDKQMQQLPRERWMNYSLNLYCVCATAYFGNTVLMSRLSIG